MAWRVELLALHEDVEARQPRKRLNTLEILRSVP